jgi:rod shape-determining protein MreD
MKGLPGLMAALALLFVGATLQQSLSQRMAIAGCPPDFLLAVLGPIALYSSPRGAAAAGFGSGVLMGALAGANLMHYVWSRCLAGLLAAGVERLGFRAGAGLAFLTTAIATATAQLLLLLFAPSGAILPFLGATMGTAVYNGVVAIPVYALLGRFFKPVSAGI